MHKKNTDASAELDNIPILRTTCKWKKKEDIKYSTHRVQGICQVCYTGWRTHKIETTLLCNLILFFM